MPAIDRTKPQPTIAPTNRITVAFPFSTVKIHEPDDRLRELAAIVAELADRVAAIEPTADAEELQQRARSLLTRIAS